MNKDEIKNKISELKAAKEAVKGTPCEVYSRVVGYLRPVQNWNKGKKEEFTLRKNIKLSWRNGKKEFNCNKKEAH